MIRLYCLVFLLSICATIPKILAQNEDFFTLTDQFLSSAVKNGGIDYAALKTDHQKLDDLVEMIANFNLEGKSTKEAIAFYINAYNSLVISSIVEKYPVESVNEIAGFFTFKRHLVVGENITLETLEKRRLFQVLNDPRFHFALICGAKGCPKIPGQAFLPEQLNEQLEQQTITTLNDPDFIRLDTARLRVDLSEIFFWYKKDFVNGESNPIDYINTFRDDPIPTEYMVRHYPYDWSLNISNVESRQPVYQQTPQNLQNYTPSVLLARGQTEYTLFNNLYSQAQFFNYHRKVEKDDVRSTFFTSILGFQYGLGKNINVGIEAWFRSVRYDSADTSPFKVFGFGNDPMARTAMSSVGPKVRYRLPKVKGFSMQTTFLFPLARDLQGRTDPEDSTLDRPFLDHDGYQLFHHFFYDVRLGARVSLFAEASLRILIDRKFKPENTSALTPFKLFISYFPNSRLSLYGMTEAAPNWAKAYYLQSGLGVKYQLGKHLELESLYTKFWAGRNSGAGYTMNLGIRVVY